jgi:hypothetical protein
MLQLFLRKMADKKLTIKHSLTFNKGQLCVDGKILFKQEANENYIALTKRIFRSLKNPYPKFHKMDRISKLAYLCGEFVLNEINLDNYNQENIAVILSNSSSTIETDIKFQESIKAIPSPALFVYTLPNIMIGELCIRFGIKGENLFFIEPELNTKLLCHQTQMLFDNSESELAIIGWVDFYSVDKYTCLLALVSREELGTELTIDNLATKFKS